MTAKRGQSVGVRKSSGIRRSVRSTRTSNSSLRPKTHVPVVKTFKNVISANDKAEKITYTR